MGGRAPETRPRAHEGGTSSASAREGVSVPASPRPAGSPPPVDPAPHESWGGGRRDPAPRRLPAQAPPPRSRRGKRASAETSAPPLPAVPGPALPLRSPGPPSRARTHLARSRPPARRTWARSPPGGAWCPSTGSARCRRRAPAAPSSWLRSRSSARRGRRGSSAACAPPCRTSRGSAGPAARPRTPARRALAGSASLRGTGQRLQGTRPGPFSARPHPQPLTPPTERPHPAPPRVRQVSGREGERRGPRLGSSFREERRQGAGCFLRWRSACLPARPAPAPARLPNSLARPYAGAGKLARCLHREGMASGAQVCQLRPLASAAATSPALTVLSNQETQSGREACQCQLRTEWPSLNSDHKLRPTGPRSRHTPPSSQPGPRHAFLLFSTPVLKPVSVPRPVSQ